MHDWIGDVRFAVRALRRSPVFLLMAVLTLALGIGANTAIFSVIDAVLLSPLPYADQHRLVQIWGTPSDGKARGADAASYVRLPLSYLRFQAFQEQNQVLERVAAVSDGSFQIASSSTAAHVEPEQVSGERVSGGLFEVMGVKPVSGRTFLPEEERDGGEPVAILSYALWERRFGGEPALGKTLDVDGASVTIVGIMPPGFDFPNQSQIWLPRCFETTLLTRRQIQGGAGFLYLVARLHRGVTAERAQAELETIGRRYNQDHPDNVDSNQSMLVDPLKEQIVGRVRPTLLVLFGAAAFVLLIAAVNVANLLSARAADRQPETAIRVALGAGRWRIVRQLLTESVLLSLAGGLCGLLITAWGIRMAESLSRSLLPRASEIRMNATVLAFTFGVAALTGILFGVVPALHASEIDWAGAMKGSGRNTSAGRERGRLRRWMIGSEVALALILLVGAGLLIQSFLRLAEVDPGFRPQHVLSAQIVLAPGRYPEKYRQENFYKQLLEKVERLPGVESAAVTSALPMASGGIAYFFHIEGRPSLGASKDPFARLRIVSPGYFETMGVPLLQGRLFTEQDGPDAKKVAIINETMARGFWPGEDPIGKHVIYSREAIPVEVVGIARDVRFASLDALPGEEMYVPYRQRTWASVWIVARATGDPAGLSAGIRKEVQAMDRDQPLAQVQTMEEVVSQTVAAPRLRSAMMGAFAALALALAAVGVFGVVAYSVAQRTRELGIRIALGAQPREVIGLVLRETMLPVLIGVGAGLGASQALARALAGMLFGVKPADPLILILAALVLTTVAGIAGYVPARRVLRLHVLAALSAE